MTAREARHRRRACGEAQAQPTAEHRTVACWLRPVRGGGAAPIVWCGPRWRLGGGAPRRGSGQRKALKSREATAPGCFCILAAVLSQSHSLCASLQLPMCTHTHITHLGLILLLGLSARPSCTPETSHVAVRSRTAARYAAREKKYSKKYPRLDKNQHQIGRAHV